MNNFQGNAMQKRNLYSSFFFLALSIFVFIEVAGMPVGTLATPRNGFWPLIHGILLAVLSLILLGQAVKEKERKPLPFWTEPGSWKRVGMTLGALFVFGLVYEHLGFLLSIFFLIGFMARSIGSMSWLEALILAAASSLASYGLFGMLLDMPLPGGILGF